MPRVVHFEITAEDPDRAAGFYSQVFGWEFAKWEGPMEYWLVTTGPEDLPGINGGLIRREERGPGTVNTIDVPSVDEFTSKIEQHGGKVVAPKMAIPGIGWFASCEDSEGNAFGLMQNDPAAS